MEHEGPLDAADHQYLASSSDEPAVLLMSMRNQRLKWTLNPTGIHYSAVINGSEADEQAFRLYLGKQIVELDPMTRAFFFRTIHFAENQRQQ